MTNPHPPEADLSQFVDRTLDEAAADAIARHVSTCPSCRDLVGDIEHLKEAARTLEPIAPAPALRRATAERLRQEHLLSSTRPHTAWRPWMPWAAAAAIVIGTGLGFILVSGPTDDGGLESRSDQMAAVTAELEMALEHYERAITQLELVMIDADESLDADVVAALRASLVTLDRAIAESRRAVQADPANAAARLSLLDALRQKVHVLQATAQALDWRQVSDRAFLLDSPGRLT